MTKNKTSWKLSDNLYLIIRCIVSMKLGSLCSWRMKHTLCAQLTWNQRQRWIQTESRIVSTELYGFISINSKCSVCCCLWSLVSITALRSEYYCVYGFWNTSLYNTITKWYRYHKRKTKANPTVDQRQKQLFVTYCWGPSGSLSRLSGAGSAIYEVLAHCSVKNYPCDVLTPYINRTTTRILRLLAPHARVKLEILGHVAVHSGGILCYNIIIRGISNTCDLWTCISTSTIWCQVICYTVYASFPFTTKTTL
jgi:hypothetical protein